MNDCKTEELNDALKDFEQAVQTFSDHLYEDTTIFIGHPEDLLLLDYSKIPATVLFLADHKTEKGKLARVVSPELKKYLYDFFEREPDRFFKGGQDFLGGLK